MGHCLSSGYRCIAVGLRQWWRRKEAAPKGAYLSEMVTYARRIDNVRQDSTYPEEEEWVASRQRKEGE